MPMHIVLDLSEKDLRYFRECLQTVKRGKLASDEVVVLKAARDLVAEVARVEAPDFVRDHLGQLGQLVDMLEDERWRLTGADRARVLNALAYFVDPDDLIPDRIPGIGYLDDAIMVELVVEELRHEIVAYEKFCEFHQNDDRTPEEIARKRLILQSRMRRERRAERDLRRERRSRGVKAGPGLW